MTRLDRLHRAAQGEPGSPPENIDQDQRTRICVAARPGGTAVQFQQATEGRATAAVALRLSTTRDAVGSTERKRPREEECMKTAVGISLGAGDQDFAFDARFLGHLFSVRRLGTNGSTAKAVKLLRYWQSHADAIGLGVVKDSYTVGSRRYVEKDSARMKAAVSRVPVTTGGRLSDILQEWALRHVQIKLGNFFNNAKVLFFSGRTNYKLALAMSEYTQNLQFADPLLQLGVPKMLTALDSLELYTSGAHHVLEWMPDALMASAPVREWTRFMLRRAMQEATVIVAPVHELDHFGADELARKVIVTSTVNDRRLAAFRDKNVDMVVDGAPLVFDHVLGPSLLDAMIIAATGRAGDDILEDDYLEIIEGLQLEPRILYPNGHRRVNRFAFVIHPLSQEYFKNVKPIELLSHVSPPVFMDTTRSLTIGKFEIRYS